MLSFYFMAKYKIDWLERQYNNLYDSFRKYETAVNNLLVEIDEGGYEPTIPKDDWYTTLRDLRSEIRNALRDIPNARFGNK